MMRALQTAPLACALMVAVAAFMCARVSAFLPAAPSQQQHQQHQLIQRQQRPLARTAVATLESVHGQQRQQKQQERRERLSVRLWAAEGEGDGEVRRSWNRLPEAGRDIGGSDLTNRSIEF